MICRELFVIKYTSSVGYVPDKKSFLLNTFLYNTFLVFNSAHSPLRLSVERHWDAVNKQQAYERFVRQSEAGIRSRNE